MAKKAGKYDVSPGGFRSADGHQAFGEAPPIGGIPRGAVAAETGRAAVAVAVPPDGAGGDGATESESPG